MAATTLTLHVAYNNCATNDPCALCGSRCDPEVGLETFVAGTFELVCDECSSCLAPELFAEVERDRKERAAAESITKE